MRVFISSQSVDQDPAKRLILRLREGGVDVAHSPSNPLDGDDPRWRDWYEQGLDRALCNRDTFVIVVDYGWDSSTWMAVEAERAVKLAQSTPTLRVCFWNPLGIAVKAAGMLPFLRCELPVDLNAAVSAIALQ